MHCPDHGKQVNLDMTYSLLLKCWSSIIGTHFLIETCAVEDRLMIGSAALLSFCSVNWQSIKKISDSILTQRACTSITEEMELISSLQPKGLKET